jgi:Flp pilus assembly protein TadB
MAESNEDKSERLNRELIELLNELRVALPGVQVLFAFLLIVPFSQGFQRMTELQRDVYFASVLTTALSTLLLIAPSSMHRIEWRQRDKEALLQMSNALAIAGLIFLALGMTTVLFLITDVLFSGVAIAVVTGIAAGLFALVWFVVPLVRRLKGSGES